MTRRSPPAAPQVDSVRRCQAPTHHRHRPHDGDDQEGRRAPRPEREVVPDLPKMRAIDTSDSSSVTPITVSSAISERCRIRTATTTEAIHSASSSAPGQMRPVGFEADLEEALGAGEQPDVAVDEVEVAQQDVAARAPADHVLGRRREVVDQPAEVARIVTDLVDQRRQPEHREQPAGPGQGSDERSAIVAAPAAHEHDGDGEQTEAARHQSGTGCGSGRRTTPRRRAGRASCGRRTRTDQVASSTTIQAISGRYGFHGWISTTSP